MGESHRQKFTAPEFMMFFPQQMKRFAAVDRKRQIRVDRIGITGIAVAFASAVDIHAPDGFAGTVDLRKQLFDMGGQRAMEAEPVYTVKDQISILRFLIKCITGDDTAAGKPPFCVLCRLSRRLSVGKKNTASVFLCQCAADDKSVSAVISFSAEDQDRTAGRCKRI